MFPSVCDFIMLLSSFVFSVSSICFVAVGTDSFAVVEVSKVEDVFEVEEEVKEDVVKEDEDEFEEVELSLLFVFVVLVLWGGEIMLLWGSSNMLLCGGGGNMLFWGGGFVVFGFGCSVFSLVIVRSSLVIVLSFVIVLLFVGVI